MKRIGPTEAERHQMFAAIRSGKSVKEAIEPFVDQIDGDWFHRNQADLKAAAEEKNAPESKPQEPAAKAGKR